MCVFGLCDARRVLTVPVQCSASRDMSARVFSRFAMSEARAPRGSPPGPEIERARRALFPPHNCAQTRQFVAQELANCRKQKSEHFNFDFETGLPLDTADARFKWQRVDTTESIPEAYALERLPFLNAHADVDDDSTETPTTSQKSVLSSSRQTSITEYMQKRKSTPGPSCSKPLSLSAALTSTSEPATKKQKTSSS